MDEASVAAKTCGCWDQDDLNGLWNNITHMNMYERGAKSNELFLSTFRQGPEQVYPCPY